MFPVIQFSVPKLFTFLTLAASLSLAQKVGLELE